MEPEGRNEDYGARGSRVEKGGGWGAMLSAFGIYVLPLLNLLAALIFEKPVPL